MKTPLPLSDDEIIAMFQARLEGNTPMKRNSRIEMLLYSWFYNGIKAAEVHHDRIPETSDTGLAGAKGFEA